MTAYGSGTYGSGTYGGVAAVDEPTWLVQVATPADGWVDVTCDVRSIDVARGRSSWVEAFAAGTATVVLYNPDGRYSTFPIGSSIWAQPGGFVTDVPIRLGAVLAGVVSWRFTGTTDGVYDSWPDTVDAIATVTATDAFKQLTRHNGGPRTAVGAGEKSGARINRLADDAGYTGARGVDVGTVTLQATTLDGVTVDLMRQVGEAEWGWLYMMGDGTLRFRQRDSADNDPRMTTVQWTFTDHDSLAGACYGSAVVGSDSDRIVNVAQVTPPGRNLSTYTDAASKAWFGPRTWTRTDLPLNVDADALGLAQVIVLQQAADDQRIDAVVIDAAHRPNNYAVAHGARITDRVRFVRTLPGGWQVDAELHIQGRTDHVEPLGDGYGLAVWDVTFQTSAAALIVGLGLWDGGQWDTAIWGV